MTEVYVADKGGNTIKFVDFKDIRLSTFGHETEKFIQIFNDMNNFKCREDDVLLFTPPKSGTHWIWEILTMLLTGQTENKAMKGSLMLEASPLESIENIPSPRVINTHLPFRLLPKSIIENNVKIVVFLRNPKDVAVSFYNHTKGLKLYEYSGKWENYLQMFEEGQLDYGCWFEMVQSWEEAKENLPDTDMICMYYEDMKQDPLREIMRVSQFLNLNHPDDFIQRVVEKTQFKNMVIDKAAPKEMTEKYFNKNFSMFRKGEVGDWKNWFTVAQNEQFDALYEEKMRNSKLKFRFTLP